MLALTDVSRSHRSRLSLLLAFALSALAAFTVAPTDNAVAAETAAVPANITVVADVHTDAIATFWEGGQLVLASKADTPAPHTRYEADQVWFHVDNDSRIASLPSGYEFVAPAGTAVWLAPEVQQANQIWPGFSTESVPAGTLDNNDTTLTLVGASGPGDVELWQTGGVGQANRLWSSDEAGFKSFTRKNVHMHANWAFTAAGTYHLTVRADATVGGNPVSDTAVYTFVVGNLPSGDPGPGPDPGPEPVATTIKATAVKQVYGKPAQLAVAVSPAAATGNVVVKAGSHTSTGELSNGKATVTLPAKALTPGNRTVSIAYAGAADEFKPSSGTATVSVAKATPRVTATPVRTKVKRGRTVTFRLAVSAAGVKPTGKLMVEVAGRTTTVKVGKSGKATARIAVPRRAKAGAKTARVTYSGDAFVAGGSTSTRIRTT